MLENFFEEEKDLKRERIEELEHIIKNANDVYYNKSNSIISDREYDELKDELIKLSPDNSLIKQIGASVDIVSDWNKAKHKIPMNSLNKVNKENEFTKWWNNNNINSVIVSEKLDGISINLEYENGELKRAITRGNGILGEDIFSNVIRMQNVKQNLCTKWSGSLRGEIIFKTDDFEKVNNLLEEEKVNKFKGMRNAASGVAKRYDHKYSEFLTILYYNTTNNFTDKVSHFKFIESLNLKSCHWKHCTQAGDVIKEYDYYGNYKRANIDYEIDGLVIEENNITHYNHLGLLNNKPRGGIAWKFGNIVKETKIIDVIWQVGKSGHITPVGIYEPILFGGIKVSRSTISNVNIFKKFKLRKNDIVKLSRANDVIPYLLDVVKHTDNELFEYPKTCPVCNNQTEIKGEYLICSNNNCQAKAIGNLLKWVDKAGWKSQGIGERFVERMYELNYVKTPKDFYNLKQSDISILDGYGDKSANKIISIINDNKEMSLSDFIGGLNLYNFGSRMAEILVNAGYDTIDSLLGITKEQLVKLKGIEEKTAISFIKGLQDKFETIQELMQCVEIIKPQKQEIDVNKLNSKSFVFTGSINKIDKQGNRFTRQKMQQLVAKYGGINFSGVKKGLDYLVQADPNSTSSKTKKAQKYGVEIISEEEFFNMIGE
ncbi:MAG: NAD-dependent DNA ligase LigA [bacterium]